MHVAAALTELGYKRIIVRTDGEAALVAFIRAVTQYWGGEVVAERSPVGDSRANGAAEMAVGLMKAHIRTLKDAFDFNMGSPLPPDHPLMTWLARHASHTYRLYHPGADGRTPLERLVGQRGHAVCNAEFGARVWWVPLQSTDHTRKPLDARC